MYVCIYEKKKIFPLLFCFVFIAMGSLYYIADEYDWLQLYENASSLKYFGRFFLYFMNGVGS